MAKPIDYSKWDHIDVSDDDEQEKSSRRQPTVTRFDAPQKVTFGGGRKDEALIQPPASAAAAAPAPPRIEEIEDLDQGDDDDDGGDEWPANEPMDIDTRPPIVCGTRRPGPADLTRNGGATDRYYWSQSRYGLTVSVMVPPDTGARDVRINLDEQHLTVTCKGQTVVDGALEHRVKTDEDSWTWEVIDFDDTQVTTTTTTNGSAAASSAPPRPSRRLVQLTLQKSERAAELGFFVWWSCIFQGDPKIDTASIEDRKIDPDTQKRWEEAHSMFRQQLREKKAKGLLPMSVPMND
ncbi:unnamed protein product [Vitrella brassicaformis CCMP3155]|uniref:CS domain-containing protein n=1 Tax=Vitrella brassicaformis (strain CCMP3155) TaxID=1169540 RepID=A0A0G4GMT4_VITBC|nr:unnamed protein product [Vitrella brassicaformis CCMP3155]|eukprot:CEM31509.1 unnamed protein product [Vitrella brassicaformis CCMP3155]